MAAKMIAFDQEARDAMRRGVGKLARAVRVTLGPRGRNVILQKSFGSPTVTKDGVTVAKEIELPDHYANMGARMVREVASKTSDVAGAGTTAVTDQQKMEVELEDPYILIYEKKISSNKDLIPVLERVLNAGKPILIICEEVEGEALATLVINKLRGTFKCAAVKAPGYGDRRKAMLEDLAILTGGEAVFEDVGTKLENVALTQLGRAKKVKIDKD